MICYNELPFEKQFGIRIKILLIYILVFLTIFSSCKSQEDDMKISIEKQTVIKFIESINTADIDKIVELMSEDHIFIDAGDGRYQGKESMRQGWIAYFKMFPDYKIEIVDITENDTVIGIFGYASGTYKGLKNETNSNYYRTPASWKAIIQNGKVKHWQVYCESKIVEEIVEKNK